GKGRAGFSDISPQIVVISVTRFLRKGAGLHRALPIRNKKSPAELWERMCITSNFGTQIPNLSPTNQSMKKLLLAFSAATLTAAAVNAQSRMALYEEFTGENCGPCATYNPNFEALLLSSGNAGKIILIKYQSPIPSAGPIYNQYKTVTNNRISYYGINSA